MLNSQRQGEQKRAPGVMLSGQQSTDCDRLVLKHTLNCVYQTPRAELHAELKLSASPSQELESNCRKLYIVTRKKLCMRVHSEVERARKHNL